MLFPVCWAPANAYFSRAPGVPPCRTRETENFVREEMLSKVNFAILNQEVTRYVELKNRGFCGGTQGLFFFKKKKYVYAQVSQVLQQEGIRPTRSNGKLSFINSCNFYYK